LEGVEAFEANPFEVRVVDDAVAVGQEEEGLVHADDGSNVSGLLPESF